MQYSFQQILGLIPEIIQGILIWVQGPWIWENKQHFPFYKVVILDG